MMSHCFVSGQTYSMDILCGKENCPSTHKRATMSFTSIMWRNRYNFSPEIKGRVYPTDNYLPSCSTKE